MQLGEYWISIDVKIWNSRRRGSDSDRDLVMNDSIRRRKYYTFSKFVLWGDTRDDIIVYIHHCRTSCRQDRNNRLSTNEWIRFFFYLLRLRRARGAVYRLKRTLFVFRCVEMTQIKKNQHRIASWERISSRLHMSDWREGKNPERDRVSRHVMVLTYKHGVKCVVCTRLW